MKVLVRTRRLTTMREVWEVEIPDGTPRTERAQAAQDAFYSGAEEDGRANNIDADWDDDDMPVVTGTVKEERHVQRNIDSRRPDDLGVLDAKRLDRLTDPALGPINRSRGGPDHDA
jgi:hypothetical protein